VSIFLDLGAPNQFICTGTLVSPTAVVTAGHCLDGLTTDGLNEFAPSQVTVLVNYSNWTGASPGSVPPATYQIPAQSLTINPNFAGFNVPSGIVNDDVAIIQLSQAVPAGVATYPIWSGSLAAGNQIVMAGYGLSGTGLTGYTISPSFVRKRTGGNVVDETYPDDEGGAFDEVYLWDFDAPNADAAALAGFGTFGIDPVLGVTGGPTLGNLLEAGSGGGDSGGPTFVDIGGQLYLAGVHTFGATFFDGQTSGVFGTGGGGIILAPYGAWIAEVTAPEASTWAAGGVIAALAAGTWARRRSQQRQA